LASRTGIAKDAQAIDYQATLNCLQGGTAAQARHFVLLSAFCLRKPLLEFQRAKLRLEAELQNQHDLTWSIVRPTAYFKSVSSQIEVVAYDEAPYVMFGNGEGKTCDAIPESSMYCIRRKVVANLITHLVLLSLPIPIIFTLVCWWFSF
jgi:divinyl chlorophyllide a 8-vinyl-reductase